MDRISKKVIELNPSTTPMNKTHFYKWLGIRDNYQDDEYKSIDRYLSRFGFVLGKSKVNSEALQTLEYIHGFYFRYVASVAFIDDRDFFDLFSIGDGDQSYWLYGADYRVIPNVKLKTWVNENAIYKCHPDNYYFELINRGEKTAVYLKYQYIIGSRIIAYIDSDSLPGQRG